MTYTTAFQQRPRPNGTWWTVWQNLQYFVSQVYDVFVNKFAEGATSVAAGNTSVAVVGVFTTPYTVHLTPTVDPGSRFWVSGITGTGFTINLSAAAPLGGASFDWAVKTA